VLIFLLFISLVVSYAFAENPTPYNEWDFDISKVDIQQNKFDLEKLDISITVLYKGGLPEGTANFYANVTNPDGYSHMLFGQTRDMSIGQTQRIDLIAHIPMDGKYSVDVWLSPPEKPFLDHVFDTKDATYTIDLNGREKSIKSSGDYSDEMVSYSLDDYTDVRYNEMIHTVIALPEDHTFEKIAVVNGKFVREYSTDTKDIYITTKATFEDLKIKIVREGNLLPLADAQDTMQQYVKFYSNDKEQCTKMFCVNIDTVEDEPKYPLWLLLFLGVIPLGYFFIKTRPRPFVNDPTKYVNDKRSKRDEKKEYDTKDYINNACNPLKLFFFS